MTKRLIFAQLLLCLAAITSMAQLYPGDPGCIEGLPHKVDEFDFVNEKQVQARLKDLEDILAKKGEQAKAVANVFGGRVSRSDEIPKLIEVIRRSSRLSSDRLWVRDMGYRNRASIELFVLPQPCTSFPSAVADLNIEEVEFSDLPSKRLSANDIYLHITEEAEARCAPAARAVRACGEGTIVEVFVVINEQGHVVFARPISAHPLNRANSTAYAKEMKFRPFEIGGAATQVSGTIKIVYIKPEEIVAH